MSAAVPNPITASITGQQRPAIDRSTAAGRMIHNIYNQPTKDSTLDRELLAKLQARRRQNELLAAQQTKPKVVPKSRAYVEPPPVAQPAALPKMLPPIGRRALKTIESNEGGSAQQQEMRKQHEEAFLAKRGQHAVATEEEKFRLQHKFQYGIEPPARLMNAFLAKQRGEAHFKSSSSDQQLLQHRQSTSSSAGASSSKYAAERRQLNARFAELEREIDERKQFLRDMDGGANAASSSSSAQQQPAAAAAVAAGGGARVNLAAKERRHRMTIELQDKIREMKEIDEALRALDDQEDDE